MNILVPAPFGDNTVWINEFNTDDPSVYHGSDMFIDPINVKDCSENELY